MSIFSLHVLRGLAALLVALGHAISYVEIYFPDISQNANQGFFFPFGIGVDFFFVLSGFLMYYTSQTLFKSNSSWLYFLFRRFLRIVPLYWTIITVYLIRQLVFSKSLPSIHEIVFSYCFLPFRSSIDTSIRPFYEIGWTLNYEMFFYFIFALLLFFSGRTISVILCFIFCMLTTLPLFIDTNNAFFTFYTSPIILEFCFGVLAANIYISGLKINKYFCYLYFLFFTVYIFLPDLSSPFSFSGPTTPTSFLRICVWGIPSALLIVVITCGNFLSNCDFYFYNFFKILGNSSYALYLFHPIFFGSFLSVLSLFPESRVLPHYFLIFLLLFFAFLGSCFIHYFFEKPLLAYCKSLLYRLPFLCTKKL